MRRFISVLLTAIAFILIIPSFALIGQPRELFEKPPTSSISDTPTDDKTPPPSNDNSTNNTGDTDDIIGADSLSKLDFYLVQNDTTGEVLKLSPVEYIVGVVAGEMPALYHEEALKAQAVAAHSYALRQIGDTLKKNDPEMQGAYLSTDPTRFQAYLSKEERKNYWGDAANVYEEKVTKAVSEVIEFAMTYEEEPILAAFHAISSGTTESAETVWGQSVPYLVPVQSEGDALSPQYEAEQLLTDTEVAHSLQKAYPDIKFNKDRSKWFTELTYTPSGTVSTLKAGNVSMTGIELRKALGLRSACFTIALKDTGFLFSTRGYGHDVGMSQYGADYMARQGKSYKEILEHYYPGVELEKI